jgi:hypothetical protein
VAGEACGEGRGEGGHLRRCCCFFRVEASGPGSLVGKAEAGGRHADAEDLPGACSRWWGRRRGGRGGEQQDGRDGR